MKIVNICGFPRSGTTFLASLLHTKVGFFALPECQFRFPEVIFTTNNLLNQSRHSKRVKKSFLSWNELAKRNLVGHRSFNSRFNALSSCEEFLQISVDFCSHYYPKSTVDFIIDHTPENLFGFDNSYDFSNQYFIFLRRSLTDVVQSHRNVNWSNQPLSLLTSRYCIYNSYVDHLCELLSSLGLDHHYLSLTYYDLLAKSFTEIVEETGHQSFFSNALMREHKELHLSKNFPLPNYTKSQHSYIGHDIAESKLQLECVDKTRFFHQMRVAYHSLTIIDIFKSFFFRK